MISRNLPVRIKIVAPVKYWCLVGITRWQNLLYTWVIIWVNTILIHIHTRAILPRYEGSCMVYRPKWYRKQKCRHIPIPYWYQEMWNSHYRNPNGIIKKRQYQTNTGCKQLVNCWQKLLQYCNCYPQCSSQIAIHEDEKIATATTLPFIPHIVVFKGIEIWVNPIVQIIYTWWRWPMLTKTKLGFSIVRL